MRNYIQPGDTLSVPAPYDVASGGGVLVGKLFGIATGSAKSGEQVQIKRTGVFEHAKTAAQAWTLGADIYWDDTNKVFTTAATNNTLVALCAEPAANPSEVGEVVLTASRK